MLAAMRGVVANLDEIAPVARERPEPYLIITRPAYAGNALNQFAAWKREKGHTVTIATTDQTGTTNTAMLGYIQNAYNNWAEPPVYVLLIGDVDGTNPLPAWIIDGFYTATDITDHPYALLDGDDWLPDVLVGRFSVDAQNELQTVVNKTVQYESQPFEPNGEWRSRMLITGVRSAPNFYPQYNSAWPTLQWIGREFMQAGYTQVDSVPAPPGNGSVIGSRINAGESFVAYRGFGSPDYWDFPFYARSDVNALSNGPRLPFVTSIVCGGGAFDSEVDPCFGETWLRAGTPANFKGAIAFIGPSELDTKTRWNNTNVAAIYEGILRENVNCAAAAMLRGKLELLRQFPNNVDIVTSDSDRSPWFYFHIYNLLGDPGLNFFVGPVQDLAATIPDTVALGTPELTIPVTTNNGSALPGAWGTLRQAGTLIDRAVADEAGMLSFELPQAAAGQYEVTITKPRCATVRDTLAVGTRGVAIATSSISLVDDGSNGSAGNGDGTANPAERIALAIRVRNFGTQAFAGGTLSLTSAEPDLQIITASANVAALAPGAESGLYYFLIDVLRSCPDGANLTLNWQLSGGGFGWTTSLHAASPVITVTAIQSNGQDANPEPNATTTVALSLLNSGHAAMPAGIVRLRALDARLVVIDSTADYPVIAAGGSATPVSGFQIQCGDFYPGDWARVRLVSTGAFGEASLEYALPIGNLTSADPTHPDGYGYRAFDDGDQTFDEAPQFAWLEIDPVAGGAGTPLNLGDTGEGHDATVTVNLPFAFRFYGTEYTQISVCSNGFLAFGATGESYLRNYRLPAIASPDELVAPFWDDLAIPATGHVLTYHDQASGRFIVEWSRLQNTYGSQPEETFEVALYNTACWPTRTGDGDILAQYRSVSNSDAWDNYATIGIQSKSHGAALLYSYANLNEPGAAPLRSNQAILFTTGRPTGGAYIRYAGNLIDDDNDGGSQGNGDGITQNGETVQMAIRLRNSGAGTAAAASGTLTSSDARITLLDATVSFPAVGPGETVIGSPVRIVVSPATPNGYVAGMALLLTGGSMPCVVIPTLTIAAPVLGGIAALFDDDNVPPSNGNGNGEVNPLETIELRPGANNAGGNAAIGVTAILRRLDTHVTLLDSTASLGNIPIGGEQQATDPCVFRVNAGVGDGSQISFRVIFRDAYGSEWTQELTYLVGSPLLAAAGLRIEDPLPGGNADGYLNGGETGLIFPRVSNSGLGAATGVAVTLATDDPSVSFEDATRTIGTVPGNGVRETELPIIVHAQTGNPEPRAVPTTMTVTADGQFQETVQLTLIVGNAIYIADYESDLDRWTVFGAHSLWHRQTRSFVSPSHAYYCGNEQSRNYENNSDEYLRSPAFAYTGQGRLLFSTRYATASPADICRVELQLGPSTYYVLGSFSGEQAEWQQREYPLEGYPANEVAKIRFWFSSNILGTAEGWYVDNVIVVNESNAVDHVPPGGPPAEYSIEQTYPNPFNDQTTIRYAVPRRGRVSLTLYNVQGQQVATLEDGVREAGHYQISWQPLTLASGVYVVRLSAETASICQKIVYLK
jgi:hypothetical protein